MKIALSGAPGTGKSTLGRLIAENTCLEYIPEVEDIVAQQDGFKHTGEIRDKLGPAGLIDNFFRSLEIKLRIERETAQFVADKCLADWGARWFANLWKEHYRTTSRKSHSSNARYG